MSFFKKMRVYINAYIFFFAVKKLSPKENDLVIFKMRDGLDENTVLSFINEIRKLIPDNIKILFTGESDNVFIVDKEEFNVNKRE